MSKIITAGTFKPETGRERKLTLDSEKLIKTRMLITANSGGGKSYLLRVLLEQLGKSTPVIVLDREGEYVTLGEKLDVVQAGPLGSIPTDPRSAAMLCRRLMEKRLAAVIDMSDLKIGDQRAYVANFLDELVSLPKNLWRPTFIALDEAHIFAPEKGYGDSEATEAVINAATLGRKRGYCMLFATQRISKFHKDAAAEQMNRFFGRITLDVDVQRAAKDLGIADKEARVTLRNLKPGEFYTYGPALAETDVVRMHVAKAQTTHPEAGQGRTLRPPKPSKAITAALAELTDLPKEAEQQIRDVTAAKKRIAQLERELRQKPKAAAAATITATTSKHDAAIITRLRNQLEEAKAMIEQLTKQQLQTLQLDKAKIEAAVNAAVAQIIREASNASAKRQGEWQKLIGEAGKVNQRMTALLNTTAAATNGATPQAQPAARMQSATKHTAATPATTQRKTPPPADTADNGDGGSEELRPGERSILIAAAQFNPADRDQLSVLCGLKKSSRNIYIGKLQQRGFVTTKGNRVTPTDAGLEALGDFEPLPTGATLQEYWRDRLQPGEWKILQKCIAHHPESMERDELDEHTGLKKSSRNIYIGRLVARRLLTTDGTAVKASDQLFD